MQQPLYRLWMVFLSSLLVHSALAAPPPGHPSTEQAARVLNIPADQVGVLSGEVIQAIDSNNYTYILVAIADGQRWLAAPRLALPVGARISFRPGTRLTNFYSKKLKHAFSEVEFVERVWLTH